MLRYKLLLFIVGIFVCFPEMNARRIRIIGGEEDSVSNHRYHVAILHVNPEDGSIKHVCGGAIIHRRFVLTAAHCVYDLTSKDVLIRAGGNQAPPENKPHLERRVYKRVARIMYPKDYIRDNNYHEKDIAVLKLIGTFDLADEKYFKKLELPNPDGEFEDRFATVSGYGLHDPNDVEIKLEGSNFKSLKTKVIHNDQCQATREFILTSGSLCTQAINEKGHACYGDGGDPLVFDNQIIGILNPPKNCNIEKPDLYTRVQTYVDFVKKVLSGRVSSGIVYK